MFFVFFQISYVVWGKKRSVFGTNRFLKELPVRLKSLVTFLRNLFSSSGGSRGGQGGNFPLKWMKNQIFKLMGPKKWNFLLKWVKKLENLTF